jgi:hypothetical protein
VRTVLREIFSPEENPAQHSSGVRIMAASFDDAVALARLLVKPVTEETLQRLLTSRPQILLGASGTRVTTDVAFLAKPKIGNSFVADYATLSWDQGGCTVNLFEIETADASLFTSKGTPAARLQSAMGQVRDWDQWIRVNRDTFVRDLIDRCKSLPLYPERQNNGSFRLCDADSLSRSWEGFGGFTSCTFRYHIVIGRWSKMSSAHRKRLVYYNSADDGLHRVSTFDQLVRSSYSRPEVTPFC